VFLPHNYKLLKISYSFFTPEFPLTFYVWMNNGHYDITVTLNQIYLKFSEVFIVIGEFAQK